ncbi:MAG: peptide chain release factor-like protein [Candidatus Gottesmanbacteria bacterium]
MNPNIIIIEIRGAAGGDEAKIWADDLVRMYTRYAQAQGWKVELIDQGTIKISGTDAFSKLKMEGGVHRVQRIPETERRGRIHTSTATVAVLPEIPETQVYIDPADIEMQVFRSAGHGGQNVQKVSSAVRIIHKPTGVITTCQTERDQWQNRQTAMSMLRAKLWELEEERKRLRLSDLRQVIGRGMRAEKIRTYNYPQDRVTDHRINKSFRLADVVEGRLDKLLSSLLNQINKQI